MKAILRRVAALEAQTRMKFPQRVVVHWEGEEPDPNEVIDDNTLVVEVLYDHKPLPVWHTDL